MSLFKNSIPLQRKSQGDLITAEEWDNVVNQLSLQTNYHSSIIAELADKTEFKWVPYDPDSTTDKIIEDLNMKIIIPEGTLGVFNTIEDLLDYFNEGKVEGFLAEDVKFQKLQYGEYVIYSRAMNTLKEVLERIKVLEDKIENNASQVDIMIGVVTVMDTTLPLNGFKTIDGITIKRKDRVLVTGLGKEHNGIYEVNEDGTWEFIQEVKPNQVVSVELGYEHGGSLQKKEHNGVTVVVKKPERAQWRVLI